MIKAHKQRSFDHIEAYNPVMLLCITTANIVCVHIYHTTSTG